MNPDIQINDEIRKLIGNLSERDVIEQVVFDPNLGIVKREIHFGIIDYLTVKSFSLYILDVPNEKEIRGIDIPAQYETNNCC